MFDRNWRRVFASVVAILALAGGVVWLGYSEQGKNRAEADRASAAYRYYADVSPECRVFINGADRAKCVADKETAAYQEHYNQADLRAQKDMAAWTLGLFWVGILGFISGAIAIVFLYANLIALDKQNDETRRIGEDQAKAYLAPVTASLAWPKKGQPQLSITYKNGGQTPAINLREVILYANDARPARWAVPEGAPRPVVASGAETFSTYLDPLKLIESRDEADKTLFFVWVYVFYQDVFGQMYRSGTQFFGFDLAPGVTDDLNVYFQNGEPMFERFPADVVQPRQPSTYFRLVGIPLRRTWKRGRPVNQATVALPLSTRRPEREDEVDLKPDKD